MSLPAPNVARLERDGRIAIVVVNYPPVNALGWQVKKALAETLETVTADVSIDALVIRCEGRTYFAGADIREFGKPATLPHLPELIGQIERCPKPVITAIHGSALGGGLELAMACHFRLATPTAKLGLPEVNLGILPGAGGTQRLPRLIGIAKALEMLTSGVPIAAAEALELGLVDAILDGNIAQQSVAFAEQVVRQGSKIRRTRDRREKLVDDRETAATIDRFEAAHVSKFRNLDAPPAILKAVRGVLLADFDDGIAVERTHFLTLRDGPQAAALRHSFFAEREAAKIPGLSASVRPQPIETIGIVGAGATGTAVAAGFLRAGCSVRVLERNLEALDRGLSSIQETLGQQVVAGRLSKEAAVQAHGRLYPVLSFEALSDADLIVESASDAMAIKHDIFLQLDGIAKRDAIFATTASYLDIDQIAAITSRPEQVLGLHFFRALNVPGLVEVVRGSKTSEMTLASAMALVKRIGIAAVIVGNAHGFIGNRMLAVWQQHAEAMMLAGVSPYEIDRVAEAFGMAMGPCRVQDVVGLDLGGSPGRSDDSTVRARLCDAGRIGRKAGAGFYDYVGDGDGAPSMIVEDLIGRLSAERDSAKRAIDDAEILERLHYPLINEGARLLQEERALRASDIDVVWLKAFGWPAWTGGPMFHGDRIGLPSIVAALDRLNIEPTALLVRLAAERKDFADFDAKSS